MTAEKKLPVCQMTMSDNARFNGLENFWECGRPAKFTIIDYLRGKMFLCGLHARRIPPGKKFEIV
jgi:hypothetical protein